MVTRPSVGIQSCRPISVLSKPSFHVGSHFTACSTFEKANKDPGASLDLCFIFSLEGWRYTHQLWSMEIPRGSHNKERQRNSFFLYSFTGLKGSNLPTIQILSYFINQILQKQEGILSSEVESWVSVEGKTFLSACVKLPASHDDGISSIEQKLRFFRGTLHPTVNGKELSCPPPMVHSDQRTHLGSGLAFAITVWTVSSHFTFLVFRVPFSEMELLPGLPTSFTRALWSPCHGP